VPVLNSYITAEDNTKIAYDHYTNGHSKVIFLAHGFFNSKQAVLFKGMADDLADDYDVIALDFRGHGKSQGQFTWTAKEFLDLEAVLKLAVRQYEKVGVVGYSLGAATSLIAAARTDYMHSLIAVSPPSEFNKIDFHFWKMGIMENIIYNIFQEGRFGKGVRPGSLWLKKIRPIDIIQDIRIPIYFLYGDKDWLILPWHTKKLYEKTTSQKKIELIKDGTHAEYLYRSDAKGMIKRFKDWFAATLI